MSVLICAYQCVEFERVETTLQATVKIKREDMRGQPVAKASALKSPVRHSGANFDVQDTVFLSSICVLHA